jgi:hypothetical protein
MSETRIVDAPASIDIDGPTHCHNFIVGQPRAYCGVPRDEQAPHIPRHRAGTPPSTAPFCPYCGLPRCPVCAEGSRRRGGT